MIRIDCKAWTHHRAVDQVLPIRLRDRRGLVNALQLASAVVLMLGPFAAQAQYVPNYFPDVPGFGQEQGVTVLSRLRPLYEPLGVQVGGFTVRPLLEESVGYNSNVLGSNPSKGSWLVETRPSVSVGSNWTRNSLGAAISVDDRRYLDQPSLSHTDFQAALGGGYTIGRGDLNLGYSHLSLHQSPTQIGAQPTQTTTPFQIEDFRANYTFDLGRLKITPNIQGSLYRFDNANILGVSTNQDYRNRNVVQGGGEFRYEFATRRSAILALQVINSNFINPQPGGGASPSSTSGRVLAGIDYQASGALRYRLLAGLEVREFSAAQFKTQVAPIVQADVIWTPTGLTTVTGSVLRTIQDPVQAASAGFTFTWARAQVDHELRRNVLLQANTGVQVAEYLQGGTTTAYYAGAGATWLLSRRVRLSADYLFTVQNGGFSTATAPQAGLSSLTTGNYTQNLVLLTLRLGL